MFNDNNINLTTVTMTEDYVFRNAFENKSYSSFTHTAMTPTSSSRCPNPTNFSVNDVFVLAWFFIQIPSEAGVLHWSRARCWK